MNTALKQHMDDTMDNKSRATAWFTKLRDHICAEFEAIEKEYNPENAATFKRKSWERPTDNGAHGGGGVISLMHGNVFEKVGVNISTVSGQFSEEFASNIPGTTDNDRRFWASGISLVAHFASPHVPPFHFNTRHISTAQSWFGGGGDMNPIFENTEDTAAFHNAWKECCDRHDPEYHAKFKEWADEYFFIRHRNEPRGIGGIFYDYVSTGDWEADFAFTQDVGRTFLDIAPKIIRKNMHREWSEEERETQLIKRGRYAEFNLVQDRGTLFGLKTGGNPEAILMSLPPVVKWP